MRQWVWMGAALALAACGGNDGGGNGTAGSNSAGSGNAAAAPAPAAGASATVRPGQWEMTTRFTRMTVANMPAGVTAPLPPPQTVSNCLTPEEAASANAGTWTQNAPAGCTSSNSAMAGGRIQGRIQCDTPQGRVTTVTNGQYSADSIDLTQQMETNAGGQTATTEIHLTGRRTGDCTR